MSAMSRAEKTDPGGLDDALIRPTRRLVGIDAARGLALIGLMAIHILPSWNEETGEAINPIRASPLAA